MKIPRVGFLCPDTRSALGRYQRMILEGGAPSPMDLRRAENCVRCLAKADPNFPEYAYAVDVEGLLAVAPNLEVGEIHNELNFCKDGREREIG